MKPTYDYWVKHYVGMSDDGLPDNAVTGDTAYMIDTQKEYINNEGDWYLKSSGLSSACAILSAKLTIDDEVYVGVIDGTDITFTVPAGTTVTSLAPTITKSADSTISPTTAQDFTEDVKYTVTAKDTVTKTVYTISVTVSEA